VVEQSIQLTRRASRGCNARMITQTTTFVLGAGASLEYGFPLGSELVTKICLLKGDAVSFLEGFGKIGAMQHALRASRSHSIDYFLEHRPEFQDVGKAAIAYCLIQAESEDRLCDISSAPNWYDHLWNFVARSSFERFSHNSLRVITFNYDRSFEHALFFRMRHLYGRSDAECAEKVQSIPIIHVHGDLGALPWQQSKRQCRAYEPTVTPENVKIAADSLRIVTEANDRSYEFQQAKSLIATADHVFFFGFGFHPESMERLGIGPRSDRGDLPRKKMHGIGYGMREAEIEKMCARYQPQITLQNTTITEYMRASHDFQRIHD